MGGGDAECGEEGGGGGGVWAAWDDEWDAAFVAAVDRSLRAARRCLSPPQLPAAAAWGGTESAGAGAAAGGRVEEEAAAEGRAEECCGPGGAVTTESAAAEPPTPPVSPPPPPAAGAAEAAWTLPWEIGGVTSAAADRTPSRDSDGEAAEDAAWAAAADALERSVQEARSRPPAAPAAAAVLAQDAGGIGPVSLPPAACDGGGGGEDSGDEWDAAFVAAVDRSLRTRHHPHRCPPLPRAAQAADEVTAPVAAGGPPSPGITICRPPAAGSALQGPADCSDADPPGRGCRAAAGGAEPGARPGSCEPPPQARLAAADREEDALDAAWVAAADAIERRLHEERLGQGTEVSGAGPGPCRTGDVWLPRHGPAGSAASKPG